jgi:starch synthase
MKILMITSELTPYAKIGGLGDVVGALPKALEKLGHDVKIIMPLYGCVAKGHDWTEHLKPFPVRLGHNSTLYGRLWETKLTCTQTVNTYFIEYNDYFQRPEIYTGPFGSHADNGQRFTFLSRAGIELCYFLDWFPDVIHVHDWPTSLVPVYLNTIESEGPLSKTATVLTIHNMEHQGIFDRSILQFTGLPDWVFCTDGLESMGNVNMLKGGLYHATKITTVSRQYANEIQTVDYGCDLQAVLKFRAGDLIGVLNGVDETVWNPKIDKHLAQPFGEDDLQGKQVCKQALQERFHLTVDPSIPVFGVVARLYYQKGIDLLLEIVPRLMQTMHIQIVVLGNGEPHLEAVCHAYASRYPGRFGAYIGYHESLAHQVYAGSDFLVMPSRFEPCGLSQMYAMLYGTLPIVRATGGLLDTVEQYEEHKASGTGFIFQEPNASALYDTIGWACSTYYDRPKDMLQLQLNGMTKDFSWNKSAEIYSDVYQWST